MRQSIYCNRRMLWVALFGLLCWGAMAPMLGAEEVGNTSNNQPDANEKELSFPLVKVAVQPTASDEDIRKRLQSVMNATHWFSDPEVQVNDGVVFLRGRAQTDEIRMWAGHLARNTRDVVAVANLIETSKPSVWKFRGALNALSLLGRDFIQSLPLLIFGLFIMCLSAGACWLAKRYAQLFLQNRVRPKLLRSVLSWVVGAFVFLLGTYIVLRVSGLTQLALTIIGGTGLVGLVVGIAFRDIVEGFLASIFLSMQRPFETGDLIEIVGVVGYVHQLNIRTTVLMTLDGNLAQVPNALVYKSTLCNFTSSPNRRESFIIGIGYDDSIDEAQEAARRVLMNHPAVLKDPEPWVLADDLGKATVNLKVYFWLNGHEHSWLKVRSSVIRLVKRAFQQQGITMPDEAREVIFPSGVPVTLLDAKQEKLQEPEALKSTTPKKPQPLKGLDEVSTKAEAGFSSDADELGQQAGQAKSLDEGENLLRDTAT